MGFWAEWETNDKHLKGTALSVKGDGFVAQFRHYEAATVDFEILNTETDALIVNRAMISVDDQNFPAVFGEFANALETFNSGKSR